MEHVLRPPEVIHVPALAAHHSRRLVYATFVLVASGISIGIITAIAYFSGHPLVVPSLGPTAFLVFNRSQAAIARPRNIVIGHLIGAISGYVALLLFGLIHTPSVLAGGLTAPRIGAAAFSIALTSGAMILLRAEHGPAGATTLIVSLGFMTTPASLGLLMAGVVGLAAEGVLIDRLVGLQLPYWSGRRTSPAPSPRPRRPRPPGPLPSIVDHDGRAPVKHRPPHRGRRPIPARPAWMIGPGEGRRVEIGAQECTVKVQDARSENTYSVLEVVLDPQASPTLLHCHYDFTECYFVLEGAVMAEVGPDRVRADAGSTICLPPGTSHLLVPVGSRPARCLCITDRSSQSDPEFLP
jgi:CBS domain-containing membrane protein